MKETLREFTDSRGLKIGVDRTNNLIRGVKILGTESRNGRIYLPQAIRDAVPLYEGAKVNINHHQQQLSGPRDYRDRIGVIRNVSVREGDGLFADFHFNPKHELAEQFLWDAEHAPENVGFSHNVTAQTTRNGDQIAVEKILKVQSVDLVADPATTRGLFESIEAAAELPSAVDNKEAHNTPEGKPLNEASNTKKTELAKLTESRDDLQKECERLRQELDQLQGEITIQNRLRRIKQLFAEAGLTQAGSVSPLEELLSGKTFIESLLQIEDEREIREQIYRRAELINQAKQLGEQERSQMRAQERAPFAMLESATNTESFVKAITS